MTDQDLLIRDKYKGDAEADLTEDLARLAAGEPLAYVIGWIPFLGLRIDLSSHPLIPRPETEWWTEELVRHIGDKPLHVLDLCAGSGAIGLAVLKHCPNARVSFGELSLAHAGTILKNLYINGFDESRATIRAGDLLAPFPNEHFDLIVANPPYIPEGRELEKGLAYEPSEALFSGIDGLSLIQRIAKNVPHHLVPYGELWLECDIENIDAAAALLREHGARETTIRNDQYERPRLVLAYY